LPLPCLFDNNLEIVIAKSEEEDDVEPMHARGRQLFSANATAQKKASSSKNLQSHSSNEETPMSGIAENIPICDLGGVLAEEERAHKLLLSEL
jgi:hypothetical protein